MRALASVDDINDTVPTSALGDPSQHADTHRSAVPDYKHADSSRRPHILSDLILFARVGNVFVAMTIESIGQNGLHERDHGVQAV